MKKGLLILIFFCWISRIFGQGEANVWYFGEKFGLNFNTTPPTVLTNGSNATSSGEGEGSSSICAADGTLLAYGDAVNLYRGNGTTLTSLTGGYSTSQTIIVPWPGLAGNYVHLNVKRSGGAGSNVATGIDYTRFSATTPANATLVGTANTALHTGSVTQALTVVPDQANGYWIVGHEKSSNNYIVYRLTNSGFTGPNNYAVGASANNDIGSFKVNSCFNRISHAMFGQTNVQIVSFNNSTGVVTGLTHDITNFESSQTYYSEFSPNGNILYVTLLGESGSPAVHRIYQFDISVPANVNNAGARYIVENAGPTGGVNRLCAIQLGPDGKVYATMHKDWGNNGGGVSVINNPDVFGVGCGYERLKYANTNGSISSWPGHGLPPVLRNFLTSSVKVKSATTGIDFDQVCAGNPFAFDVDFNGVVSEYKWNIDANLNTSIEYTTAAPSHTYNTVGTYKVLVTIKDNCNYIYKDSSIVKVNEVLNPAGNVTCAPVRGNITSAAPAVSPFKYVWSSNAAMTNIIAQGATNVALPLLDGPVYVKTVNTTTTASAINLNNGPSGYPSNSDVSIYKMAFSVNKSLLRLTNFKWASGAPTWNATNITENLTVKIVHVTSGKTVWSNVRNNVVVLGTGSGTQFLENVNLDLAAGSYEIIFTSSGTAYKLKNYSGFGNISDAQGALTHHTNVTAGYGLVAGDFNYTLTTTTFTDYPCSNVGTINFTCPLPVHFISTSVNKEGLVQWKTSWEKDNAYYEIEKKVGNGGFEYIAKVLGAGTSTNVNNYEFIDPSVSAGIAYYRIKQVDVDGSYSYSDIISLNIQSSSLELVKVYPNPSIDGNFSVITGIESNIDYELISSTGEVVRNGLIAFKKDFVANDLVKGIYILKLFNETETRLIKLLVE